MSSALYCTVALILPESHLIMNNTLYMHVQRQVLNAKSMFKCTLHSPVLYCEYSTVDYLYL